MKQLLKNILFPLCLAPLAVLISCGGGSSAGNENNEDTAPATLDKTTLSFSSDLVFNFNRLEGDATSGGTENGFCNSFTISDGQTFAITNSNNESQDYDLPTFASNISYTYQKLSANSGEIIITGDGRGDGDGSDEVDLDGDGIIDVIIFDLFEVTEGVDIFVNQAANGNLPFVVTVRINFGSTGASIANVSVDVNVLGTSSLSQPSVNFFQNTSDTSTSGLSFKLQDGNDVPINYDLSESSTIVSATVESIVPSDLSSTGPLTMTFDSGSTVSTYNLNGIRSDDQGFEGTNIIDQGIYNLTVNNTSGQILDYTGIPYSWETQNESDSSIASVVNRGLLTIEIPNQVNSDGTAISERTERYVFEFDSLETGRFVQIQPDTTNSVRGSFEFPFADDTAN